MTLQFFVDRIAPDPMMLKYQICRGLKRLDANPVVLFGFVVMREKTGSCGRSSFQFDAVSGEGCGWAPSTREVFRVGESGGQ